MFWVNLPEETSNRTTLSLEVTTREVANKSSPLMNISMCYGSLIYFIPKEKMDSSKLGLQF